MKIGPHKNNSLNFPKKIFWKLRLDLFEMRPSTRSQEKCLNELISHIVVDAIFRNDTEEVAKS